MSDFSPAQASTPVSLGSLEIRLYRADPDKEGDVGRANFRVMIKYSPGGSQERTGDLWPHLTVQERTQLAAFMDSLYTRAAAAILPE